jgi:hypothetical protein
MDRRFVHLALLFIAISGLASAQTFSPSAFDKVPAMSYASGASVPLSAPDLPVVPVTLPRMAPELALQAYQGRSAIQAERLAGYSAVTVIHAELPETAQSGEYELERHFSAPRSLQFTALRYTGDGFVKSNVIIRLLQSEVDHLKQDDKNLTAISDANYKFSYKGTTGINGRVAHTYQVKPRKKRASLFKGRIFLDAYTGSLVRAEGAVVKSPSFFVKHIEFVQDYTDVGEFTFPVHVHSDARARVIGRTVVDIYHRDYQPVPATMQAHQTPSPSSLPAE